MPFALLRWTAFIYFLRGGGRGLAALVPTGASVDQWPHSNVVVVVVVFWTTFYFSPLVPQKKPVVKKQGGKKKKQILKFTLDCTHPVEDGIMDAANFVGRTFDSLP